MSRLLPLQTHRDQFQSVVIACCCRIERLLLIMHVVRPMRWRAGNYNVDNNDVGFEVPLVLCIRPGFSNQSSPKTTNDSVFLSIEEIYSRNISALQIAIWGPPLTNMDDRAGRKKASELNYFMLHRRPILNLIGNSKRVNHFSIRHYYLYGTPGFENYQIFVFRPAQIVFHFGFNNNKSRCPI